MEILVVALAVSVVVLVNAAIFVVTYRALYKSATADMAFVRTGKGQARVVIDGGAFVIGFLHAVHWVSLATMRIPLLRRGRDALVSREEARLDASVELQIRVRRDEEHVLRAARSFGDLTTTVETVAPAIQPKLAAALHAAAAAMTAEQLHTERARLVDAVRRELDEELGKVGLELESLSILQLERTGSAAREPATA